MIQSKRLDCYRNVIYAVAGITMIVMFIGLPGTRIALAFAAWGAFDSCPEALILGGRGETAAQARENKFSITISGPVWNVFGAITAAAYVFALCLVCYSCVARLNLQRDSNAEFELEQ